MAEKEALSKASPATADLPSDATNAWQSERLELVKARDEALARANVSNLIRLYFPL